MRMPTAYTRLWWTFVPDVGIVRIVDWMLDVLTPLGFRVHCSTAQWDRIATIKHPPMRGRLQDVIDTLVNPDEIRRSSSDAAVLLFHRQIHPRWVCAVVKREGADGFLVTAYPADKIKRGDVLWTK